MKIRTLEDLVEKLDEDLAWRKKEIFYLTSLVKSGKNQDTQLRAGITFLYAHWEGFIKNASELYLIYVRSQKHKFSELRNNFIAIKFHNLITECKENKSICLHNSVFDKIINTQDERCSFEIKGVVKTDSNLNSQVLETILTTIGLDNKIYELKNNLIDATLIKTRNEIVHGGKSTIDIKEYEILKDEVINLLNDFKNRIENAVVMKEYLIETKITSF